MRLSLPVPQPKQRPARLDTNDRKAVLKALDVSESNLARKRAAGRCEIFVVGYGRCTKRDTQLHHMLGGWGRRARGKSALMEHKQRACTEHHKEITGHVLKVLGSLPLPVWTDVYEIAL